MRAPSTQATAWLLVALAAASGCIDVICLTRLNAYFASVITGNLVHFGHAIATGDTRSLAGAVVAVGGYAWGWPLPRCRYATPRRVGTSVPRW